MKRAPAYLQAPGRRFWLDVLREYVLEDSHHLKLLEQACSCLDRIAQAQQTIEAEGAYFPDRFGQPREHPAMKCERDNKVLFSRCVRELCLDVTAPAENYTRPKQLAGYRK